MCWVDLFDVDGEKVSMKHIARISICNDDLIQVSVIISVATLALLVTEVFLKILCDVKRKEIVF